MEKMTYVKALDTVLNGGEMTKEVAEKLTALRASIAKKNAADKKPTAKQTANAEVQEAILSTMEDGKLYTVTDLMKCVPECADFTNQRVSALVRQLKEAGKVERIQDKGKAYFRKIEESGIDPVEIADTERE